MSIDTLNPQNLFALLADLNEAQARKYRHVRSLPVPGSDDLLEPWPTVCPPQPPRQETGE